MGSSPAGGAIASVAKLDQGAGFLNLRLRVRVPPDAPDETRPRRLAAQDPWFSTTGHRFESGRECQVPVAPVVKWTSHLTSDQEFGVRVLAGVPDARVVELVDALDSESSGGNPVEVRLLSRAPSIIEWGYRIAAIPPRCKRGVFGPRRFESFCPHHEHEPGWWNW